MITIIGATHPGVRDHNEDCFAADTEKGIGLVADGMGGYACGEVASDLVKKTVVDALTNNEGLKEAIARAHSVVKKAADNDSNKRGMGSTVIALKLSGVDYEIAWVGDSRAYLWNGELNQITRDHSYVENLLATGAITEEEATHHPNRNLITQAVGVAGEQGLEISVIQGRLEPRQQLLLCSDGLVDELMDHQIAKIIRAANSQSEAVSHLIDAAVDAGGHDNITVLIAAADDTETGKKAMIPEVIRSTATKFGSGSDSITVGGINRPLRNSSGVEWTDLFSDFSGVFRYHNQVVLGSIIVTCVVASLLFYLN